MIRLGVHRCHDPATQCPAFTFLVPQGWRAQSGLTWNQSLLNPVTPAAVAQSPDGAAWLALLPNAAYSWVDDGRMPEGSMEYGAPILRPRPAADVLLTMLIPRVRPGIGNLRVVAVEHEPAPPWPSQLSRRVQPGDDSIRATVEYTMRGRAFREIVSLVSRVAEPTPMPTLWGIRQVRYWFTFPALSVGGPVDRWDEYAEYLDTARRTFRVEPTWIQALERLFRQASDNALQQQQTWFAAQQAGHRAQVAMGEQLVHMGQDLSNSMDDIVIGGYEQRGAVYDRIYDDQYLATMGLSRYDDPSQPMPVELPYGYESVWSDGQGDYILSEDPSYDPNSAAPGPNWQRLDRTDR
ncbi:hypothetical protein [Nocardia aurantia]|uniref:Uncharacterized protein n=1 Tax=Nocardia aurantia TaxID=2585199 RepID=A0A7K0DZL7_9NOCA|nr:hypothetical protein [Nocardia aurantia]MQY31270.1 hypothetical protein [Nocardia aurantia]